jgi:hypothetical protein
MPRLEIGFFGNFFQAWQLQGIAPTYCTVYYIGQPQGIAPTIKNPYHAGQPQGIAVRA